MTHANYIVFDDDNNIRLCEYNNQAHMIAYNDSMEEQRTHYVLCLHDLHLTIYKWNYKTRSVDIE